MNQINTLHKYFIWSNRMRIHFVECLKKKANGKYELEKAYRIESNMYMSLWYGMLHVVIEGWRKLRLEDQNIQKLLRSKNVKLLEKYRNGVCHFEQNESYDGFEDFLSNQILISGYES